MVYPIDTAREIRVFLSSTFKDMHQERDHLLKHVFPTIRERCAERGVGFTEIDLRWGVTEEEAKNGTTVAICLSEIDRCRGFPPFFIGFLGERYGWIPTAEDLASYFQRSGLDEYSIEIKSALKKGISVTELEFQYALQGQQLNRAETLLYLRSEEFTKRLYKESGAARDDFYEHPDQKLDSHEHPNKKLDALKRELRQSPLLTIDDYNSVEAFGDSVKAHLLAELDRRYPENEDARSRARELHLNFARTRVRTYVPQDNIRLDILEHCRTQLAGQGQRICLIQGESGVGKSALMADLAQYLPKKIPDAEVIDFYVGADGQRSIQHWADWLSKLLAEPEGDSPMKAMSPGGNRWDNLAKQLKKVALSRQGKPLVLLLDALNQLADTQESAELLQNLDLPEGVVLILSATPELQVNPTRVLTYPLARPTKENLRKMVGSYTANYRKALSTDQIDYLVAREAVSLPLHLNVVLEQLRVRSSHESLNEDLEHLAKYSSVGELFLTMLHAWDCDYADYRHPVLASRAAGLLSVSRAGLTEQDLGMLLAEPEDPIDPHTGRPRLPRETLSQLLATLRPYLIRTAGRATLMHAALEAAALNSNHEAELRQRILAASVGPTDWEVTERIHQCARLSELPSAADEATQHLLGLLSVPAQVVQCQLTDHALLARALRQLGGGLAEVVKAWSSVPFVIDEPRNYVITCEALRQHDLLAAAAALGKQTLLAIRTQGPEAILPIILNIVGAIQRDRREIRDAIGLLEEALSVYTSSDTFRSLLIGNLAACYIDVKEFSKAQRLFSEALNITRTVIADGNEQEKINLSPLLNNAAQNYRQQLMFEDAVILFEEAISVERSCMPAGSPELATMLNNLGDIFREQGRMEHAELSLQEAWELEQRLLPDTHLLKAHTQVNLGLLYDDQGSLDKAATAFSAALEIYGVCEGNSQGGYKTARRRLAQIRLKSGTDKLETGHLEAAENEYMEAMGILRSFSVAEKGLEDDRDLIARTYYSMGKVYKRQEQLIEAEQMLKLAMSEFPAGDPEQSEFIRSCWIILIHILKDVVENYEAEGNRQSAADAYRDQMIYLKLLSEIPEGC